MKRCVLIAGVSVLLIGCGGSDGPELHDVGGYVTMDGEPLPNASVHFIPDGEGVGGTSPSFAKTDEDGYYYLQYSLSKDGAIAGDYKVRISTHQEADPDLDPPQERHPETVPVQYNRETTLTATVPSDSYDFAIESDGEVYQPLPGDEDGPDED